MYANMPVPWVVSGICQMLHKLLVPDDGSFLRSLWLEFTKRVAVWRQVRSLGLISSTSSLHQRTKRHIYKPFEKTSHNEALHFWRRNAVTVYASSWTEIPKRNGTIKPMAALDSYPVKRRSDSHAVHKAEGSDPVASAFFFIKSLLYIKA